MNVWTLSTPVPRDPIIIKKCQSGIPAWHMDDAIWIQVPEENYLMVQPALRAKETGRVLSLECLLCSGCLFAAASQLRIKVAWRNVLKIRRRRWNHPAYNLASANGSELITNCCWYTSSKHRIAGWLRNLHQERWNQRLLWNGIVKRYPVTGLVSLCHQAWRRLTF